MEQQLLIGTEVKSKNKRFTGTDIISEVTYDGNCGFEYATINQAWFNRNELIFVNYPSDRSLKILSDNPDYA